MYVQSNRLLDGIRNVVKMATSSAQALSEQAIRVIQAINFISPMRRILNLIFGSTLHSNLTLFLFHYY